MACQHVHGCLESIPLVPLLWDSYKITRSVHNIRSATNTPTCTGNLHTGTYFSTSVAAGFYADSSAKSDPPRWLFGLARPVLTEALCRSSQPDAAAAGFDGDRWVILRRPYFVTIWLLGLIYCQCLSDVLWQVRWSWATWVGSTLWQCHNDDDC